MKNLFAVACMLCFSATASAFLNPVATGTVDIYNAAQSYEVVIDGDAAEKIYVTLDTLPTEVQTADGSWLNKVSDGIVCGQNLKTEKYSCSLSVNESGLIN